jgi:hypothetical protein
VDSEYWELVSIVLIQGLEDAKDALENVSTSDTDFRLRQGEAKAYRETYNFLFALSKVVTEENNGEAHD